jgi:hypothetical protein
LVNASRECAADPLFFHVHDCAISTPGTFIEELEAAIVFVRKALLDKGRVLVYSATGSSDAAAFAIGIVMSLRTLGYYESFTRVRDHWFITDVHPALAEQLLRWERTGFAQFFRPPLSSPFWVAQCF